MRPTQRSGYVPAIARALFEAFPEWEETVTVVEEMAVIVTSGVTVSKPCLLIRVPFPVAPRDTKKELLVEIAEDEHGAETTIFFDHGHSHLTWWPETALDEHKAHVVGYVRDIVTDAYVTIYFLNAAGEWAGTSIEYKPDQSLLSEPPPPGMTKHIRSWTGLYDTDIQSGSDIELQPSLGDKEGIVALILSVGS